MVDRANTGAPLRIKGKWSDAGSLPTLNATELSVIRLNDQYVVTFGELRMPMLQGEPSGDVPAEIRPTARLIIPASAFDNIVKALGRVVEKSAPTGADA